MRHSLLVIVRSAVTGTCLAVVLGGCASGRAFVAPAVAVPDRFDQAAEAQPGQPGESALWSAFNDPALSALLARAQRENKSIAQASARLQETRALRGLAFFGWLPTITAAASADRSKSSNLDPFIPAGTGVTEDYRSGFDASWEIDLFGGTRNQLRAVTGQRNANSHLLDAARLSVSAEVAQAYFALRGAQQRLEIQNRNIENLLETDRILDVQLREGRGNALAVAQNRALSLQVSAQVPGTEAEVIRQEQRLAVLTAQPVAAVRTMLAASARMPELPTLKAIGTPEQWIRRRPDVRAAEQQFAAARARVGVQSADYFPKLNLLGSFGWTAQQYSALGSAPAERWSYGPSLSWSFLNVGRVRQNVRAAKAQADAAAAAYQQSVLLALEDTEDALAQYRASNQSEQRLQEATEQSRKARDLAKLRYASGASDFLSLLDSERTLLGVEDAAVQARTAQATALALVYKALAGDFAGAAR